MADRLSVGPGEALNRDRRTTFTVDGRRIAAFEGDMVGSAMAAAGITTFSRSFKYHRPRGLSCMAGACPNCLVTVDGVPNVRACVEPVRPGMIVRRQNAWPSADTDVMAVLDSFSFMMPPGFYYKIFHKPRFLWPLVEPFIRRAAGLGKVPREEDHTHLQKVHLHPEVLVVGGGPAGLAAAVEASRAGAEVLLIESAPEPGGHLRSSSAARATDAGGAPAPGWETARSLAGEAVESGTRILTGVTAFGVFEGGLVAAFDAGHLYRIRPQQTIFATGAYDQPAVFPNNDLPGVMLGGAVDRLLLLYRVLPGRRAVVAAFDERAYATAKALAAAGADVVVLDPRPSLDTQDADVTALVAAGGRVLDGAVVTRADGGRRLRSVGFRRADGSSGKLEADLLVIAGVRAPALGLLAQAGMEFTFDERAEAFVPVRAPEGMRGAGEAVGARSLPTIVAQGRLAGLEAAASAGHGGAHVRTRIDSVTAAARAAEPQATMPPLLGDGKGKQFACVCMDVTSKELSTAVKEGFDSIELLKRYTTLSMGPCQGKACLTSSSRLCASVTGRAMVETGLTTARPPWAPIPLGVLAADRPHPTRTTAMHDRHVDAGASFLWAGEWRRPHHYVDPAREVRAVHQGVGLIDVSTLGKLRVKGPDAVAALERLYPNTFGDLRVGRIRYGLMLNDQGVILDDGTVCRLADDEFFVTVTTGGTDAMDRWIGWWLADWGLRVHVANVSAAFAAVNLAGPESRRVMERLTDMDVSAEALPYMGSARGDVAGVPSLVLRLGFVGELGYEIHFPSAYGEYLWNALLEAGADLDILPFGLEAQRILRLEKKHILVGQDTDALSDPYGAGLAGLVKLDKADFLGRRALVELQGAEVPERLVGLRIDGDTVPPEGSAIVEDGRAVGRLTSSRWSEAAGGIVGMGWVPAARAEDGEVVTIGFDGRVAQARVADRPFYDPEGSRLRS
jgi:sarcosine oxidase subunit alpha